jgi:hypothetical protein
MKGDTKASFLIENFTGNVGNFELIFTRTFCLHFDTTFRQPTNIFVNFFFLYLATKIIIFSTLKLVSRKSLNATCVDR